MTDTLFGHVLTAMVTPFDAGGCIDEPACVRLIDHLFATGSSGLVVCGTTGESPSLTRDEKLALFRLTMRAAAGRGPVIAGTGSNCTADSVRLSVDAAELGVQGLLLVVPPYNKPSQDGLYRHFRTIAESVPQLPCLLYNVPARTAQNLEATTTLALAAAVRNIVGVKEASGDLMQCTEIVRTAPAPFMLYSGEDALTLPMLAVGAAGVVSVAAHVIGNDICRMHDVFFAGDTSGAARLHARMLPVVRALFQPTTPSPAPVKAALNMLGIGVGGLRLPLVEVDDREREVVRLALTEYGLL